MNNSDILKFAGIIGTVIGIVLTGCGIYKRNYAQMFIKASNYVDRSFLIWSDHKRNATIMLVIGLAIIVIGLIIFFVGFLKANAVANPESDNQTSKVNTADNTSHIDIEDRLAKLDNLKSSGIITNEEYDEKRKKIIDEI